MGTKFKTCFNSVLQQRLFLNPNPFSKVSSWLGESSHSDVHRYEPQWHWLTISFGSGVCELLSTRLQKLGIVSAISPRSPADPFPPKSVTSKTPCHCKIICHDGIGPPPLWKGLETAVSQNDSEGHRPTLFLLPGVAQGTRR